MRGADFAQHVRHRLSRWVLSVRRRHAWIWNDFELGPQLPAGRLHDLAPGV